MSKRKTFITDPVEILQVLLWWWSWKPIV